jgi:GNAT superfamily N-acetyltransferase
MPEFTVHVGSQNSDAEVITLYESVGWTAYTEDPAVLVQAIRGSAFVVTCRSAAGELVGLARAISDDATICYVQDILVAPSFQGSGAGRTMLEAIQSQYGHVRQTVLHH